MAQCRNYGVEGCAGSGGYLHAAPHPTPTLAPEDRNCDPKARKCLVAFYILFFLPWDNGDVVENSLILGWLFHVPGLGLEMQRPHQADGNSFASNMAMLGAWLFSKPGSTVSEDFQGFIAIAVRCWVFLSCYVRTRACIRELPDTLESHALRENRFDRPSTNPTHCPRN